MFWLIGRWWIQTRWWLDLKRPWISWMSFGFPRKCQSGYSVPAGVPENESAVLANRPWRSMECLLTGRNRNSRWRTHVFVLLPTTFVRFIPVFAWESGLFTAWAGSTLAPLHSAHSVVEQSLIFRSCSTSVGVTFQNQNATENRKEKMLQVASKVMQALN
jgi:hypothetical protein